RYRGAPGGTAQATEQYQWVRRCQQGASETDKKETSGLGPGPGRPESRRSAQRPQFGLCVYSLAPLPVRKLWQRCEPANWLVAANTSVLAAEATASSCTVG